jgi:hypothetical protein
MTWQEVEAEVRRIAESVWAAPAAPKTEGGIKCDVILKIKPNYWILLEVSKRDDLNKIRDDVTKLAAVRMGLMARQIFAECYFVTTGDPSSLVETGAACNVEVYDLQSFASKFIAAREYVNERRSAPFGSAVDPDTGSVDRKSYTPISYVDSSGHKFSDSDIADLLRQNKKLILMGEFGTGKSRCLMQVFEKLATRSQVFVPVAINLRDNWGYRRFNHIIANHLDALGLGYFQDTIVRSLRRGNHVLLLDGFDEIGSQSWSGDPARLNEIRKKSLEGVRDLVENCPSAGILLTGREHYFGSDEEMAECIGIPLHDLVILRCPDEFTESEANDYIRENTALAIIPEWMPRKPLICQLLARLDNAEVEELATRASGEVEFFESVFDSICARETRINPAITKEPLKGVLLELARHTRSKPADNERISTIEINQAFFDVTTYAPIDESAAMLQRLPYLGRVGSGSSDRIFIDPYAKDGLRGMSEANSFARSDRKVAQSKWLQPLERFGVRVFGNRIKCGAEPEKFVRLCINHGNYQVACDYIALKIMQSNEICDFQGLSVSDGKIPYLEFVETELRNLHLSGIEIDEVTIEAARFHNVDVRDCVIGSLKGVGSTDKLPDVFQNCHIERFQAALTISRISELNLPNSQKTLLALIKKLFFQPGAGRQEQALLRGAENYWDAVAAQEVLSYMQHHDLILKIPGDHGDVFIPRRRHTRRMARIWELQSNCDDELWLNMRRV